MSIILIPESWFKGLPTLGDLMDTTAREWFWCILITVTVCWSTMTLTWWLFSDSNPTLVSVIIAQASFFYHLPGNIWEFFSHKRIW